MPLYGVDCERERKRRRGHRDETLRAIDQLDRGECERCDLLGPTPVKSRRSMTSAC